MRRRRLKLVPELAKRANRIDRFGAQFIGDLTQLCGIEAAQICRDGALIEQRRFRL